MEVKTPAGNKAETKVPPTPPQTSNDSGCLMPTVTEPSLAWANSLNLEKAKLVPLSRIKELWLGQASAAFETSGMDE